MQRANQLVAAIAHGLLTAVLITAVLLPGVLNAQDAEPKKISITLGDYRFSPHNLTVAAGQPVLLELINTDKLTPHNFTLVDKAGNLDIDVNVSAGATREVSLTPQEPGTYTFYCSKKLPFMKSHREHGMEGSLVVTPDNH